MKIYSLRMKILLPLMLAVTILLGAFTVSFYRYQQEHIINDVVSKLKSLQDLLAVQLDDDAGMMGAALEVILRDDQLKAALKAKDRKALLERTRTLYDQLRSNYRVTHFYFTGPDRVNILRVHQPDRHGDIIDRLTTKGAEKTGKLFYGIELGPLGTFTLRVVAPWYEGEQLLGYVELGEEIEHNTSKLHDILGVEIFMLIEKKNLNRENWEAGMKMLGRKFNWNRFPSVVMVYQTADLFPEELARMFSEEQQPPMATGGEIASNELHYRWALSPLKDAGGRPVGNMVIMRDITSLMADRRSTVFLVGGICLLVGGTLFVLFFIYIGRVERQLESVNRELIRINKAVEGASDAIILCDMTGKSIYHNKAFLKLFEYSVDDLNTAGGPSALFPDPEAAKHVNDIITGGTSWSEEMEMRSRSGRSIKALVREDFIEEKTGKIFGMIGIFTDITERKRAEEALQIAYAELEQRVAERTAELRASNEFLERENTGRKRAEEELQRNYDVQTVISSLLRFSLENIPLKELLKRSLDIILSIPWLAFEKGGCIFLVEDAPEVLVMKAQSNLPNEIKTACAQVPFGRCLCGRAAMNQQTYFADCIDDSHEIGYQGIIPHGHYCVPILFGSKTLGVLNIYIKEGHVRNQREEEFLSGIANTLTAILLRNQTQKEMATLQEQLRQSQKMEAIGQLAGGIAHDFNNLLTIMKGHSQLALMNLKEGEPLRGSFEEIEKATTKSANLVRQILAFSRRQVMEMIVLDLNTLLRDLEKMLRRIIGEDIGLLTGLADDLGRVKADPGQIEQVVFNLAVNARDAMPQGGKLTIETANVDLDKAYARSHVAVTPGRYVMIAVSDTGVGMTPEIRERVFEPFFTTKEKGKGTGLGLATVYGIVKQSGGNIWVYTEPGQGTTFKIYLPRVDEPLTEEGKKEEPGLFLGIGVILVVEDEEGVRKLVLDMLKKQGYSVLEAANEEEALLLCQQYKDTIHLMVTDVVMPRISGPELAKRLVVIHPEMKVLYMSGYADSAIVHHGVLKEGVNFIQKPFTIEGLAKKVREVLDKDPKPAN